VDVDDRSGFQKMIAIEIVIASIDLKQ